MSKGRYIVFLKGKSTHDYDCICGVYASSLEKAITIASQDLGYAKDELSVWQYKMPSGWKRGLEGGNTFVVKYSKFGVKYKCIVCGKQTLGVGGGHNHWAQCPINPKKQAQ
jgi:hypothetical protein